MAHIHSKDTGPEVRVRRELWRRGFRFRVNVRSLPGSPDIVLPRYRTAIFVNGCFWHGHKGCSKYVIPKTRTEFWQAKIARNQERDLLNNQRLESLEWYPITIWECELEKPKFKESMDEVEAEIRANEARWEAYRERRRSDRQFALAQARKHRALMAQIQAEIEAELNVQIPASVRKLSKQDPGAED